MTRVTFLTEKSLMAINAGMAEWNELAEVAYREGRMTDEPRLVADAARSYGAMRTVLPPEMPDSDVAMLLWLAILHFFALDAEELQTAPDK